MIAPVDDDDGGVLGAGRRLCTSLTALNGTQRTIAQVAPAGARMNDDACDPQGRFWGGTLADDPPGRQRRALPPGRGRADRGDAGELTIANGLRMESRWPHHVSGRQLPGLTGLAFADFFGGFLYCLIDVFGTDVELLGGVQVGLVDADSMVDSPTIS